MASTYKALSRQGAEKRSRSLLSLLLLMLYMSVVSSAQQAGAPNQQLAVAPPSMPPVFELPGVETLPSVVVVPFTVSFADIEKDVQSSIERHFFKDNDEELYDFRVTSLNFRIEGPNMIIDMAGHYWAKYRTRIHKPWGGYFWWTVGSCGVDEDPRNLRMRVVTRLRVDRDWKVVPETSVDFPETGDCRVTFLNLPADAVIRSVIRRRVDALTGRMHQRIISRLNLAERGKQLWAELCQPVSEPGSLATIAMNPFHVGLSPLQGTDLEVSSKLVIRAFPLALPPELPAPKECTRTPALGPDDAPPSFNATALVVLPFARARDMLRKQLIGDIFIGGNTMRVDDVEVDGSGRTIILGLRLGLPASGVLYISGEVAYEADTTSVVVRRLRFTDESVDATTRAGLAWITSAEMTAALEKQARFSVGGDLARTRQEIEKRTSRKLKSGIQVSVTLKDFEPLDVVAVPESVRLRMGAAELSAAFLIRHTITGSVTVAGTLQLQPAKPPVGGQ